MNLPQLIFLVGYRGSGKTTVGRALASRLGWQFLDTDEYLELNEGRSVKQIFAAEGEKGFRDRESATLANLSSLDKSVISTGGGVVLRRANHALLKNGFVAWLTAPAEVLWDRIAADLTTAARRPNLTAAGGIEEVRALLAAREPLYREVADFTLDAGTLSPEAAADAILVAWNGGSTCRPSSGAPGSSSSA